MRVLWVTAMWPDEQRPWHGSFVHSQAISLQQQGVELDVVYIEGYRDRKEYARAVRRVNDQLRENAYDLVHAHYGWCGLVARLQTRAPLVISYCGDDLLGTPIGDGPGRYSRASLILARTFAQLAYVVQATITKSKAMEEKLPIRCRARNHVIPNGVDLSVFAPIDEAAARRRLGWSEHRPNVLFVGDPEIPRKNVELAREVCAELARRGRPVELRMAWNIAPGEMPVWMSAANVLLFPSLSEGSPNTIKEAMASQLPIVSGPVGDVRERLDGVPGTFVVEHDVDAMADATLRALAAGRAPSARQAIEDLRLERVADRVLAVYNAVSAGRYRWLKSRP